jgi:two-component system, LuxR family, response regulator FixJ
MPGMSGLELAAWLRKQRVNVPVILMTSNPTEELRLSAALSGISQVLEKPPEDDALMDAVTRMRNDAAPRFG